MQTERVLLRAGFFLFLLALLTGLAIPQFHNPRLALSAHLTGLMNSFVLTSLAVAWPLLSSKPKRARIIKVMFLFSAYTIWFSNVLGAAWGANWFFPLAGKGFHAAVWQQFVVAGMVLAAVTTFLVATTMVVWELRPKAVDPPGGEFGPAPTPE